MTPFVTSLLGICDQEWQFFGRSRVNLDGTSVVGRREYEDGAWQRVADYWRFLGGPYQHLTGKDRGYAWSAAFISWCMHEAQAGDKFRYSASHANYINRAIKDADVPGAAFVGQRLKGYPLQLGDLIGNWRGETKVTFDNARQIGWYQSHTEIVVNVDKGRAETISGNVLHSVTKRELRLGKAGDLTDGSENWFVAIQCNL